MDLNIELDPETFILPRHNLVEPSVLKENPELFPSPALYGGAKVELEGRFKGEFPHQEYTEELKNVFGDVIDSLYQSYYINSKIGSSSELGTYQLACRMGPLEKELQPEDEISEFMKMRREISRAKRLLGARKRLLESGVGKDELASHNLLQETGNGFRFLHILYDDFNPLAVNSLLKNIQKITSSKVKERTETESVVNQEEDYSLFRVEVLGNYGVENQRELYS